ncbi:MAG TPA: hypothetical protein VMG08_18045 [Allosphingosinicella sp.]|nr:hypothetical protein [Allosphingosinicella sp.]
MAYMKVRRIVAGGMLIANLAMFAFVVALVFTGHSVETPSRQSTTLDTVLSLLFLPLLVALLLVRSKRASLLILAALNLDILIGAVAPMVQGAA